MARREHACLFVEFEETKGILVTGGKFEQKQKETETERVRETERESEHACLFVEFEEFL